jgi:hypothetical protein
LEIKKMKRHWLILVIFVVSSILFFHIGCQKEARRPPEQEPDVIEQEPPVVTIPSAPEPTKKGPRIKFEKVVHDFGNVAPKSSHRCEFKFTNVGDDVLKLRQPASSCPCTVGKLDKLEYAPGESGVLRVTKFRLKTPQGLNQQPLYITSNDKSNPRVKLIVKARAVPKVAYEPKKLKLLLNNDTNDEIPEIKLTSLDGRAFAVKSFRATTSAITADYDPSLKATSHVIQPRINAKKLQKRLKGRVTIRLTHPGCDSITIPFDVMPQFKLQPSSITIFDAEPEKPVRREVWVLHNYGRDFEVGSASTEKGIIEVLNKEKVGNRYKFTLRITPPADARKGRFADVFYVKIKDGTKLKVDCNGFFSGNLEKSSGK